MKRTLYLTTPIFYVNSKPHLGHALCVVLADSIKRWYTKLGFDVLFVTGTDEHGEKIYKTSKSLGIEINKFVDDNVQKFKDLWYSLGIEYDIFSRTTDLKHKSTVLEVFSELEQKNLVYFGDWKGGYCTSCEESFSEKYIDQKSSKTCKLGHEVSFKNDPSYFLKTSEYKDWLVDEYTKRTDGLLPTRYKKEMVNNFISELEDLSISRNGLDGGIKVASNPNHTFYVGFDALLSYLSSLGGGLNKKESKEFGRYWESEDSLIIQIIGKEICRFHSIYGPIILESLGIRKFDHLLIHGGLLMDNEKMSKSKGNVIDPSDILKTIPRDGLRLFFMKLNYFEDNSASLEGIFSAYNTHLANNIGNLVSRFYGILGKKFDYVLPDCIYSDLENFEELFQLNKELTYLLEEGYSELIFKHKFYELVDNVLDLFKKAGKMIEIKRAGEFDKDSEFLKGLMVFIYRLLCIGFGILSPVLIDSSKKIYSFLGRDLEQLDLHAIKNIDFFRFGGVKLNPLTEVLFPRVS